MADDVVTNPPEAPAALSAKVPPDNNTTNPPVDSCALSEISQEENTSTTSTIANIPVDMVSQTPKIQIWRNSAGEYPTTKETRKS